MNVLWLNPNHKDVDMIKINEYVRECYEKYKDNKVNGKTQVKLCVHRSGLTRKEMSIAEGIILFNGHDFWEY